MHPRTSIVILCLNELQYSQKCVASIRRHATGPYELVMVDNGSRDGTAAWLAQLANDEGTPAHEDVVVVTSPTNLGFGGGCNAGIAASSGARICLLNNDTVVTAGWLDELHAALDADPRRGAVGPRSNSVAHRQQVDDVPYDMWSLDGLDNWAGEWTAAHAGECQQLPRLIGFCMLMPRAVFERIGGFDLRFGAGNFEDDDLCMRVHAAGWMCWMASGSYVHHFGSRTFTGAKIEYSSAMADNWRRFEGKWQVPAIIGASGAMAGYDPSSLLRTITFEAARDYAPIVATSDDGARVAIERRALAVLVPADAARPEETRSRFDAALAASLGRTDLTLVVRIDPADDVSLELLAGAADALGEDAALADITIVQSPAGNDTAVLRSVDAALCTGTLGWALAGHARCLGVAAWTLDDLHTQRGPDTSVEAAA